MTHRTSKSLTSRQPNRARFLLEQLEERCVLDIGLAALYTSPAPLVGQDYEVRIALVPNDTSFASQWALHNTGQTGGTADADIDAVEAWNLNTGSLRIVVGIIDTGIDYTHPDLYKNIWINQGELPGGLSLVDTDSDGLITFWDLNESANAGKVLDSDGDGRITGRDLLRDVRWANGADNDGNGKVDDLVGWNFITNTNDPFDDNSHGTHVAGTIGAMSNNSLGVAGVNHKVQMAGLKFLSASGSGYISHALAALNYCVQMGIPISNNSWGGGGYSTDFYNALVRARTAGHIFVAAAGNAGSNNDSVPSYPASYNLDNVVSVAATDHRDLLASFSCYGATSVDIGAPGVSILSTIPGNRYASYSGTSMATPHVAGALALLKSQQPGLSYAQLIQTIYSTADRLSSLSGKVLTAGRLNLYNALSNGSDDPTPPPPTDSSGPYITRAVANATYNTTSVRLTFSEPINARTFTAADITSFLGPAGAIRVSGLRVVSGSNNTQFDVVFAGQTRVGSYSFYVGPNLADVQGNLMDQDQDGQLGEALEDRFRVQFNVIAPPKTFTNSVGGRLVDFNTRLGTAGVFESSIVIRQNVSLSDLNVKLNLTHTYDGDLKIILRHVNSGRSVVLSDRNGGSGDNYTNTVFDDEASTDIWDGAAPFTGSFRAEQSLSAFAGINALGTWVLRVEDHAAYDVGRLVNWSLIITEGSGFSVRTVADSLSTGAMASSSTVAQPFQVAALGTLVESATIPVRSTLDAGVAVVRTGSTPYQQASFAGELPVDRVFAQWGNRVGRDGLLRSLVEGQRECSTAPGEAVWTAAGDQGDFTL